MASRFYFPSSGSAPITPAIDAAWDHSIPNFARYPTGTSKDSTSMADIALTTNDDMLAEGHCHGQWISGPITAQTITAQTIEFQMRAKEDHYRVNARFYICVRVVSNDGSSVRGTLLSLVYDNLEFDSVYVENRRYTATSTQVVTQANDRIVIEIGHYAEPDSGVGGNHNCKIRVGDSSGTDLPEDDTDQNDYNPWFEFPNDITFAAAGVTVTPAAASAVGSVAAPTVIKGSLTISSLVASAVAAVVVPAVILGSVSITPTAASAVGAAANPTVVHGSLTLTPAAAAAVGAVTAPTVALGSTTAIPSAAAAVGSVASPTVVYGSLAIAPTAASAVGSVANPTVNIGSGNVSVTPAAAAAIGSVVNPTVALGSTSVTPTAASAIGAVANPTIELGSTSVTPTAASAVGSVVNPTVNIGSAGNVNVSPAAAAAVGSVAGPTVALGSTTAIPSAAAAVGAVANPTVNLGSTSVTPAAASAIGSVANPTVIYGSVAITPSAAAAVGSVANPTVAISGDVSVTPAAASAVGAVVNPTVSIGSLETLNIRKSIHSAIAGYGDLVSIIGTRIYWMKMPQGVAYPAVTFETLPTAGRVRLMGTDSALAMETLRVAVWGKAGNLVDMETATGHIKTLLQDHMGVLGGPGGIEVERIFLRTNHPTTYSAGVDVYEISQYFDIWYQES